MFRNATPRYATWRRTSRAPALVGVAPGLGQRGGQAVDIRVVEADGLQQQVPAHLGLEASDRPAVAHGSRGLDERVPELARIAARAGHEHAALGDAPADAARAAVEVDDGIHPARRPEHALGDHAAARVIAGDHRHPGRVGEHRAHRRIAPAQVRGQQHAAVLAADEPRHGEPHPERAVRRIELGAHAADDRGDDVHELGGRRDPLVLVPNVPDDAAAERHDPDVDGVDLRVHCDRDGVVGRRHHRARAPDLARGMRVALLHEAAGPQLRDEPADRRPVEARRPGQLGAGDRAIAVGEAQHLRQVLPADDVERRPRRPRHLIRRHPHPFRGAGQRVENAASKAAVGAANALRFTNSSASGAPSRRSMPASSHSTEMGPS